MDRKLLSSKNRNILIIGKTGAGKATIANTILGAEVFKVGKTIQSATRQADDSLRIETHLHYKVALVDTVGVQDDRQIEQKIKQRLDSALNNLESLNLIIFVFKNERFTIQERESFNVAISYLKPRLNASAITALVVTCCEQKDTDARQEIIQDLSKSNAAEVVKFATVGVYLVGLPMASEIPPPIKEYIEEVMRKDQQQLQHLVTGADVCEKIESTRSGLRFFENWRCDIL